MKNILTVCLITYNHAKYIQQALNSIINQKTSFEWNIHIYDDNSTDGTIEILHEYKKRHPEKIILKVQAKNIGAAENWRQLLQSSSALYLAYLEGDDYWIDEEKLQKQYALLESNKKIGLVYSRAKQINSNHQNDLIIGKNLKKYEIYLHNPIPTPTVVIRRECLIGFFEELNHYLEKWKMGDYPLWLWISSQWDLAYIEEPMSAYRILNTSATRSTTKTHWILSKLNIRKYFYEKNKCLPLAPYYWIGTSYLLIELIYHKIRGILR